jgi:hypothetical protein
VQLGCGSSPVRAGGRPCRRPSPSRPSRDRIAPVTATTRHDRPDPAGRARHGRHTADDGIVESSFLLALEASASP